MKAPRKVEICIRIISPPGRAAALDGGAIFNPDERKTILLELRIEFPFRHIAAFKVGPTTSSLTGYINRRDAENYGKDEETNDATENKTVDRLFHELSAMSNLTVAD